MKKTLLIITALMLVVGVSDAQTYKGMRFNDDGSKSFETYKESKGKLELVKKVSWYSNGNKESEGTFKDGKKDGLWNEWHENGQKKGRGTFKDGKPDGLWTYWFDNGQKEGEGTLKDGELDGLSTTWYENGQKEEEVNYKNGKLISSKCWDEDGNECECSEKWWEGCK